MKNRLAGTAFAVACLLFGCGSAARAQASSDFLARLDQLENQLRQVTGMLEQEQFRNRQLEAALKRMQDDYEARFQRLGARAAAPPRPSAAAAPPLGAVAATPLSAPPAPTAPGRRSDAFDPADHPGAPGAPRALGSIYANTPPPRNDGPAIAAEEAGGPPAGAPLDLAAVAAPGTAPRAPGGPGGPGPPGSYAVATAPPTPRDSLDLGYGYLQRHDHALAEETFRDFLRRYPSDRLAGDAQYGLGESLYQRQAYRDAADAFLAMSKKYESSVKAPDALLRLGQSLAAINEKELACATFGEVGRKYPRASANVKQAVDREQKRVHC